MLAVNTIKGSCNTKKDQTYESQLKNQVFVHATYGQKYIPSGIEQ